MGTMKFALKMLKADFKRNIFYGISLIFSSIVICVFLNMTTNPNYGGDVRGISKSFTTILALIVVIISCVMSFFANSYYLSGKAKELAIESICGGSVLTLANYILTQNTVIMLMTIPLGTIIGYALIPLLNAYLYPQLGITANIWTFYSTGFWMTIVGLWSEMMWLVLIDTGYAYRTEVTTLLSLETRMKTQQGIIVSKLPGIIYIVLYIAPCILMLFMHPEATIYIVACFMGTLGISGLLKETIPLYFKKLTRKHLLTHKHKIISIGNLNYSLRQSTTLIQMVVISAVFLVCFMGIYHNDPKQLLMIIMSYGVLTILMAVSIAYKVIIEADVRKKSFRHLKMIGYITSDIKRIIRQEVTGLFTVIIVFPMIYLSIIIIKFTMIGKMTITLAVSLLVFYVIVFIIAGYISNKLYLKTILGNQKKGK